MRRFSTLKPPSKKPISLHLDTRGLAVTSELVVLAIIAVIGMIVGLTSMRDAVVSELSDVSGSIQDANQSYLISSNSSADSFSAGSQFTDALDVLDSPGDLAGQADNCIRFTESPTAEIASIITLSVNGGLDDGIDTSLAVRRFGSARGPRAYLFDADDIDAWQTTARDNLIELWDTGFNGVDSQDGDFHAEINANNSAQIFQEYTVTPGDVLDYSVWHRGRTGVDVAAVLIGAPGAQAQDQILATGNGAWVNYTGTYTVPAGVTTLRIGFESISTASGNQSVGNFVDSLNVSVRN